MKFVINILFILSFFITTQSFSDSFKSKRAEAVKDYNNGKINLAFKKLKSLVKKGDSEAARDMGILLIKGKRRDIDDAFYWFEVSAKMCNSRSLEFLKSQYNKRGGLYFKPAKIEYIKSKCANYKKYKDKYAESTKKKKLVEKPKNKKIKKQKNKEKFLQKPKPTKPLVNQYSEKIDTNDNYLISEKVKNSWKKIFPKMNKNVVASGMGSGFAISANGHFLTNHHVIKNCVEIDIIYNSMIGVAKLLKSNIKMDSAILKVDAKTPYYSRFDTKKHAVGETLYAAGFPVTSEIVKSDSVTLTNGMLINTQKINSNWVLMSVPIASGNSGGPVFGKYGLIRGQTIGGYDVKKLIQKAYGNKIADEVFISNITMNLMISSVQLKKWIDETNIVVIRSSKRSSKFESDEIGLIAKREVSRIFCYKYK